MKSGFRPTNLQNIYILEECDGDQALVPLWEKLIKQERKENWRGFQRREERGVRVQKGGKTSGMETPPCLSATHYPLLALLNGEIRKMGSHIPDICKFWYTIALFSPVKVHPKVCEFITKLAIIGQIMLKSSLAWKSTPSPVLMVLTNISKGVFMDLCISYHTITFSFLTMG